MGVAYANSHLSLGDWIRTSDLLHPMQTRYRAALHPENPYRKTVCILWSGTWRGELLPQIWQIYFLKLFLQVNRMYLVFVF